MSVKVNIHYACHTCNETLFEISTAENTKQQYGIVCFVEYNLRRTYGRDAHKISLHPIKYVFEKPPHNTIIVLVLHLSSNEINGKYSVLCRCCIAENITRFKHAIIISLN